MTGGSEKEMPRPRKYSSAAAFNEASAAAGHTVTMTPAEYADSAICRAKFNTLRLFLLHAREREELATGDRAYADTAAGRIAAARARENAEFRVRPYCALRRLSLRVQPFSRPATSTLP